MSRHLRRGKCVNAAQNHEVDLSQDHRVTRGPAANVTMMDLPSESSNFRPGEPLRQWEPDSPVAAIDVNLVIGKAAAGPALASLLAGQDLSAEETIAVGRLNSYCVLEWWEPLVMLIDKPTISAETADFLRSHAKALRRP